MSQSRETATDTVRRMKENDIARQMVMRYQQDPNCIHHPTNRHAQDVRRLYERVNHNNHLPQTVGEWIAFVLHHGSQLDVAEMRRQAREEGQVAYMSTLNWLQLIDNARVTVNRPC